MSGYTVAVSAMHPTLTVVRKKPKKSCTDARSGLTRVGGIR